MHVLSRLNRTFSLSRKLLPFLKRPFSCRCYHQLRLSCLPCEQSSSNSRSSCFYSHQPLGRNRYTSPFGSVLPTSSTLWSWTSQTIRSISKLAALSRTPLKSWHLKNELQIFWQRVCSAATQKSLWYLTLSWVRSVVKASNHCSPLCGRLCTGRTRCWIRLQFSLGHTVSS